MNNLTTPYCSRLVHTTKTLDYAKEVVAFVDFTSLENKQTKKSHTKAQEIQCNNY